MATPNFVHGKLSTVSIGGTSFAATDFDVTGGLSDLTDITFTQTGGATFAVLLPGYRKAKGSVRWIYDTANQIIISPFSVVEGASITFIFTPDGTKQWSYTAFIEMITWGGGPKKGPVGGSFDWQSSGTYTYPSS